MPNPFDPATIFFDLGDTLIFTNSNGDRQPYADAFETLQILKERGYRLGVISNQLATTTVNQVLHLLSTLALSRYIEPELVTISSEIPGNVGKPEQPIFDLALSKAFHAQTSTQAIFIAETPDHIQKARNYGWRAVLKRITGTCQPIDGECVTSLAGLLQLFPSLCDTEGTNFHLAPPPKLVDGLWAVPIDIQRIEAALTFDGATVTATGDATLHFRTGRNAGCPIFDLRQTITGVWLDGAPLQVADVIHHDFGGGLNAELLVAEFSLPAATAHTLRVTYDLNLPQSSGAGSYLPGLSWNGPRLTFNFGFTDLGAGRYLEAWVPSNLIYDQYEIELEIRLLNTAVNHSIITNGEMMNLGANHWRLTFSARSSSFSPLLEIRASDQLSHQSTTISLPVSGTNVTIDAWKPSMNTTDLTAQVTDISTHLEENEISTGQYLHDNRFTAFFHKGGMEYDGGTTTAVGALRHEIFHSWWGRGLKPASQADAWFDEAWTVYNMNGAMTSVPFNFTSPPVTLCSQNAWQRVTASNAYWDGNDFWEGMAAIVGAARLRSLMADFYKKYNAIPVTTAELEAFLVAEIGDPAIVDAFHRFVYGLPNPSPTANLWLRDAPGHAGEEHWPGRFWDSPDLWIRNDDDNGLEHQDPEYGQDNWFHARIRNNSTRAVARHFVVTFNVKSFAGTQFAYPSDFLPCISSASEFELAPGETRIAKARWPANRVPPPGTHPCLLSSVLSRFGHPVSGRHVWEENALAQKNLRIVDLKPGDWIILPFVMTNFAERHRMTFEVELVRPRQWTAVKANLLIAKSRVLRRRLSVEPIVWSPPVQPLRPDLDTPHTHLDCSGVIHSENCSFRDNPRGLAVESAPAVIARLFPQGVLIPFPEGYRARLPVRLFPYERLPVGLRIDLTENIPQGTILNFDIIQLRRSKVIGGVAVRVRVR
jgi:FMN phosphatase YigB (HAD superfamily)